ncbi:putative tRNA pseudouridine synthase 2-like protein [Leptotrombidium deliense]|uniref:Putative tRNA pseudouridine synthase 2-like protein n=1 Tax=Leptotrombidium deliense TaxID=299467 RepID=A0A443S7E6_9ACAR|nr:putative tRNA pseudouridine synthase 2-like protein [Leptotrombidium deliense]
MGSMFLRYAPDAYRLLNGVFCAYKPFGGYPKAFRTRLINNFVEELNSMKVRPPQNRVEIVGSFEDEIFNVQTVPSYSDMPAVVGPRYAFQDFSMMFAHCPPYFGSGVTVVGIGSYGCYLASELKRANFLRVYELKCKFGYATDTFLSDGKVIEKSTHRHVGKERLDYVLNRIQSGQQTQMFNTLGIDLRTQYAYEKASVGLIRPKDRNTAPVVYGLKCIHLAMPDFTVELSVINEDDYFIASLVNDIGLKCKTNAVLHSVRCTRYGSFTVDHCLLEKHCTVENVIENLQLCKPLVSEDKLIPMVNLKSMKQHQQSFLEVLQKKKIIGTEPSKNDEM